MTYSDRERIAHVFRRLGVGAHASLVDAADSVDDAIATALDLSLPWMEMAAFDPPSSARESFDIATLNPVVLEWVQSMIASPRILEERLVWYWHDHFATSVRKVGIPYLMWRQLRTIRRLATGSFRDLLHGIAIDPAMLLYLDGIRNHRDEPNENFAREVMELHTLGPGAYTQGDIVEGARAAAGWIVNVPFVRPIQLLVGQAPKWDAVHVPMLGVRGTKTILGRTGGWDLADFMDILLERPETPRFIATRMATDLIGVEPDPATIDDIVARWSVDDPATDLVEAIVDQPLFTSDDAIRAKVRTPLERVVSAAQGFSNSAIPERLTRHLHSMSYLPFDPPTPAGFPRGGQLLDPYRLIHGFDITSILSEPEDLDGPDLLARIGIHDISPTTASVLDRETDPARRTALALNAPEFALT